MKKFVNNLFNYYFQTDKGYMCIIDLLKKEFPEIKIDFSNLENLQFVEMSESEYQSSRSHGIYRVSENKIYVYKDKTETMENIVDTLVHEMIHSVTSKIVDNLIIEGFNFRENLESSVFLYLNEGITQYIANRIMKSRSDAYPFESKLIEQLLVFGNDNELIQGFFNMDFKVLLIYLQKIDKDLDIHSFINKTYYSFKFFYSYIFNDFRIAEFAKAEFYKLCPNNKNDIFYILQEEFLNLYKKSGKEIENFSELMLSEEEAEKVINPPGILEEQRLDINLCGFKNIDELRNLGRKVS